LSKPVLGLLAGLAALAAASALTRRGSLNLAAVQRLRQALKATAGSANRAGSRAARKKAP